MCVRVCVEFLEMYTHNNGAREREREECVYMFVCMCEQISQSINQSLFLLLFRHERLKKKNAFSLPLFLLSLPCQQRTIGKAVGCVHKRRRKLTAIQKISPPPPTTLNEYIQKESKR